MRKLRVITRSSPLAIAQVAEVMEQLPGLGYNALPCKSYGDKHKEISLMGSVPADFFTRELDQALLNGSADIAVHSAKDLPEVLPEGLALIALTKAEIQEDALVSKDCLPLHKLPKGATVGTSSITRKTQLLTIRPDLKILPIRGSIGERLQLLDGGIVDALIVAACALYRLGLEKRISEILPFETHPLQGRLAVVARQDQADLKVIFSSIDSRLQCGKVYVVGVGAGDRQLLTRKADEILGNADILFSDDLIDTDMLKSYRAKVVYVGKRKGKHHSSQDEINHLLYSAAQKHQVVVRVKGGDPFIFGRGGEEVEYLSARYVPVEVVPGISAMQVAAASTGIPLTMRGVSNTLSLHSAHSAQGLVVEGETKVFYMGATQLSHIAKSLKQGAMPDSTPVALVHHAGFSDETVTITTLKKLASCIVPSPLMVIAGPVVAMYREQQKILFTGLEPYRCFIPGKLVHYPLIEIEPVAFEFKLSQFDGIVFTSKEAVRIVCARYKLPKDLQLCSIGSSTTRALENYGYHPAVMAPMPDSDALMSSLSKHRDKKYLYPCSSLSHNVLHTFKNIKPCVVYATHHRQQHRLDLRTFAGIVFTSPSTVDSFFKIYSRIPHHLVVSVYGKHTESKLRKYDYDRILQTLSLS